MTPLQDNHNIPKSIEPKLLWRLFGDIAKVPRPSKSEQRICKHLHDLAVEQGLPVRTDDIGNLVISVPASKGFESAPTIVLQAHVDMVCEKISGKNHDFDEQGISLVFDTDAHGEAICRGDGTTLGADNGIGVAMALAAALSPDVTHGPLELLFTVDEEAGMSGVKALTPSSFTGRVLLNLDSEEDDALYIGCAGGCDTTLTWSMVLHASASGAERVRVVVDGLRGGHSGCDVHENRGCAVRVMAQTLLNADVDGLRLETISGGSKRNAIARAADAIIHGPSGTMTKLTAVAERVSGEVSQMCREPNASIRVERLEKNADEMALNESGTLRILQTLTGLPHGVLGLHPTVPGLVETSNNVATIGCTTRPGDSTMHVEIGNLTRSSSTEWMTTTLHQLASIGRLAGAEVACGNDYPGWDPNPDSPLLAQCRKVYTSMFKVEPKVAAIHAGLECGIIGKRVGAMDMISFGPRIEGAHSPDERVYIASVQKMWDYLKGVLEELAGA